MMRATSPLAAVNTIIAEMTRPGTQRSHNSLSITKEMVRRLGLSKELGMLKFVHVAGTKGKGSTCYATAQLLHRAGIRVGLFTSPHLVDVRERCLVNMNLIDEQRFTKYFTDFKAEHDAAFDAEPWEAELKPDGTVGSTPTKSAFFRFMFLLALRVFAAEAVEVVVLEVGIGGRIDATNVVEPSVCGITALGLDHMELLGNTTTAIAGEKAGIIKPGVPVFSCPQRDHPETLPVLEAKAREVGAPYSVVDDAWYADADWSAVRTRGDHMVENAKLALALAREYLGKPVDAPVTAEELAALAGSAYNGRSHVVQTPVCGVRYFLDGAHTIESVQHASRWFFANASPGAERDCSVLFFTSRDEETLLRQLVPHAARIKRIAFVRFAHSSNTFAPITPERLGAMRTAWQRIVAEHESDATAAEALKGVEIVVREEPIESAEDLAAAAKGGDETAAPVPTFVTGSLYLIGTVLGVLRRADPSIR